MSLDSILSTVGFTKIKESRSRNALSFKVSFEFGGSNAAHNQTVQELIAAMKTVGVVDFCIASAQSDAEGKVWTATVLGWPEPQASEVKDNFFKFHGSLSLLISLHDLWVKNPTRALLKEFITLSRSVRSLVSPALARRSAAAYVRSMSDKKQPFSHRLTDYLLKHGTLSKFPVNNVV